jgi:DNA polymerase-3 subunit alpha
MATWQADVERFATVRMRELPKLDPDREVTIVALPGEVKVVKTRRGDRMAFAQLEDVDASVECVFFSEPWARSQRAIQAGEPVVVTGKLEISAEGEAKIRASAAELLSAMRERATREIRFTLSVGDLAGSRLDRFKELLAANPGACTTRVSLAADGVEAELTLPDLPTAPVAALVEGAQTLFGRADVVVLS